MSSTVANFNQLDQAVQYKYRLYKAKRDSKPNELCSSSKLYLITPNLEALSSSYPCSGFQWNSELGLKKIFVGTFCIISKRVYMIRCKYIRIKKFRIVASV